MTNLLSDDDGADKGKIIRENVSLEGEGPDKGCSIYTECALSRRSL